MKGSLLLFFIEDTVDSGLNFLFIKDFLGKKYIWEVYYIKLIYFYFNGDTMTSC